MISGWEWIVIVLIVLAILLWGPAKLPELARSIGLAKREFEKAAKETEGLIKTSGLADASAEEALLKTAKTLGIVTEGKTTEQISQEIIQRAKETKEAKQ
jgi:sec-independent protein translocase protein TatA